MQALAVVLFPCVVMLAALGLERLEARLLGMRDAPQTSDAERPDLEIIAGGAADEVRPEAIWRPQHGSGQWLERGA